MLPDEAVLSNSRKFRKEIVVPLEFTIVGGIAEHRINRSCTKRKARSISDNVDGILKLVKENISESGLSAADMKRSPNELRF